MPSPRARWPATSTGGDSAGAATAALRTAPCGHCPSAALRRRRCGLPARLSWAPRSPARASSAPQSLLSPGDLGTPPRNSLPWGKLEGKLLAPVLAADTSPAQPGAPRGTAPWHCRGGQAGSGAPAPEGFTADGHPGARGALDHATVGSCPAEPPRAAAPRAPRAPGVRRAPAAGCPAPPLLLPPLPSPRHAEPCAGSRGPAARHRPSPCSRHPQAPFRPGVRRHRLPPAPASPQAPRAKREPSQG